MASETTEPKETIRARRACVRSMHSPLMKLTRFFGLTRNTRSNSKGGAR